MIKYFQRHNTAPAKRALIAYCPEWNESGYQVCFYDERGFHYDEMPNDAFDSCVTHWALLPEIE